MTNPEIEAMSVEMLSTACSSACVGEALRRVRADKGLSTRDLAKLCPIEGSHISEMERGKRQIGLDHLRRLMAALGIEEIRLSQ